MTSPDSPSDSAGRLPAGVFVSAETVRVLREATGEEAYALIRAEFLSSTERRLAAMALAAQGGDAEALRRAAHALRGASGSLGATGLEAQCRALEASLAAGMARGERPAAVARMAKEFAAVRRALLEDA